MVVFSDYREVPALPLSVYINFTILKNKLRDILVALICPKFFHTNLKCCFLPVIIKKII